jgi:hypothetical protein
MAVRVIEILTFEGYLKSTGDWDMWSLTGNNQ